MSYDAFDQIETRCPRLGHQVNFGYCRQVDSGLPCSRAIDCFYLKLPAEHYFRLVLREETFQRIFLEPGPDRYQGFLQVLDRATRSQGAV